VIWPALYEKQRRVVLSASMLGVEGHVQREGEVVHVVADRLHDLSGLLASVGDRDAAFPLPHGRGDELRYGSAGPDPRDRPSREFRAREIHMPDGHVDVLKVRSRDFR
jgi:error-prone DNA polymerase